MGLTVSDKRSQACVLLYTAQSHFEKEKAMVIKYENTASNV